jgi:hypothetical protein
MTKQAMEAERNNGLYLEKVNPADKAVFEMERSTVAAALRAFGGNHPEGSREYVRGVFQPMAGDWHLEHVTTAIRSAVSPRGAPS